jgi:hypothetical protein
MLRRPELHKSPCSSCSSVADDQETKALSNKRTIAGCSCSSTGGSVIKPLRHLARQVGGSCYFWFLPPFLAFSFIGMVDIRLVAASSHPSRRERESEREATSRTRAGRLRRAGGRMDATIVVLESQPRHTVGTTTSPPAAEGIDAALLVVH